MPDGSLKPYPDQDWNAYRNAAPLSPADHFVCVQAETADGHGGLWVIEPAAPNTEFIVPGGPKLVKIDLASNRVARVYLMDGSVAPQGSYLNDVRLSPDGQTAYMTDSGAQGALVVLDLVSGKGPARPRRRRLHPGRQDREGDGRRQDPAAARRPRRAVCGRQHQPRSQGRLSHLAAADRPHALPHADPRAHRCKPVAGRHGQGGRDRVDQRAEDGLWQDSTGRLFFTAVQDSAIAYQDGGGARKLLVVDPQLRWPDTFAQGPDGALYVTNSDITDSPRFHGGTWGTKSFNLWKIVPDHDGLVAFNPAFAH